MSIQVRLRTSYQVATSLGVDRVGDVIRGVVGMQQGEALGHRMIADAKTLDITSALSNAEDGLPSRFGHPGMSENATGKKLGKGRDFYVDGNSLRFNLHMMQAARTSPAFGQDPVEYVLNVADEAPSELGISYVLYTDFVWALQDGTERPLDDDELEDHWFANLTTPPDSVYEHPVMRPTSVHFVDIVNEGALTSDSGLLEAVHLFDGRSSEYLHEMFALVDEWRAKYQIPINGVYEKVDNILQEYMHSRGGDMSKNKYKRAAKLQSSVEEDFAAMKELSGVTDDNGPADGEVDELDELAAGLQEVTQEIDDASTDLLEAEGLEEYKHLQEQVAYALGSIETLKANQEKLTSMMRDCLDALTTLSRNQSRLSGEVVATEKVQTTARRPLEQLEFAHPVPNDVGVTPRNSLSAAQRSVQINAARQRAYGRR